MQMIVFIFHQELISIFKVILGINAKSSPFVSYSGASLAAYIMEIHSKITSNVYD